MHSTILEDLYTLLVNTDSYFYLTQTHPASVLDVLVGMDANTYGYRTLDNRPKGKQDLTGFIQYITKSMKGMTTYLGEQPVDTFHTTYNGRTYLQPQLNKAMTKEEAVS